jgi:hypothetical protein
MPIDDLDAARAFAQKRKPATKRTPKVEVDPVPVTGESVYDVRDRLHKEERSIAAEVAGLNVALEQARVGPSLVVGFLSNLPANGSGNCSTRA